MSTRSDLANGIVTSRSYVLCVAGEFSFDDFTSGVGLGFCTLPVDSVITGGALFVTTNWDSGTTAGLEIGDSADDNRYLTSENLLAAGDEYAAISQVAAPGYVTTSATDDILIEVTETGTAATAGAGNLFLTYVDVTKGDENFE
jgi:hypothetical protein